MTRPRLLLVSKVANCNETLSWWMPYANDDDDDDDDNGDDDDDDKRNVEQRQLSIQVNNYY